jgi:NAD-dependent DNA ligase
VKIYKKGINTIIKIIRAKKGDLEGIKGFKEKSIERIIKNIKEPLKGISPSKLLGASGVFGYGVARKRVIALMTDIPDLLSGEKEGLKERILEVEGFSEITARKVYDNIDEAIKFIDEISEYVVFENTTRVSDVFIGKKYVFTGFRSKDLEDDITNRGGKICTSLSKKTDGLIIAKHEVKETVKVRKAKELGVSIYLKEEFIEKYIK